MRRVFCRAVLLSVVTAMTCISIPQPAGALQSTANCLTGTFSETNPGAPCPPGSARIVAFASPDANNNPNPVFAVTSSGAVYENGTQVEGMDGQTLEAPIVGIASTSDGQGYWLVGADGGVFAFGDAPFLGSIAGQHLNAPIVGIARSGPNGAYLLVGADGGVFAFGPVFYGSMAGHQLNAPIVGIASTGDGQGYWLVGADGGVFAFGFDAGFYGSMAGQHLNAPIVGITQTWTIGMGETGTGYFLAGADGGIFAFGSASFAQSGVGLVNSPVVGVVHATVAFQSAGPPTFVPEIATTSGDFLTLS